MKKRSLLIPILLVSALAGCDKKSDKDNLAPTLTGVKDIECFVNSTVDFYDGIAALDKEDGDITPNLKITVEPAVTITNGLATFTRAGEYTVTYEAEDSKGAKVTRKSFVDVVEKSAYRSFGMAEGFKVASSGKAEVINAGMKDKKFIIEAKGGEISEDLRLTKSYSLESNKQYDFEYYIKANKVGRVKVLANGVPTGEAFLKSGENVVKFSYKNTNSGDVEISLCFGEIDDVNFEIEKVIYSFPQEEKDVDLTEGFSFKNRLAARLDDSVKIDGENILTATTNTRGDEATLSITHDIGTVWKGGMFIDTGVKLRYGYEYEVKMHVESPELTDTDGAIELALQRGKWVSKNIETKYNNDAIGDVEFKFSPNEDQVGNCWIYLAAGLKANTTKISNFKVTEKHSKVGKELIKFVDYTTDVNDDYSSDFGVKTEFGKVSIEIKKFAKVDGDQKLVSPVFKLNGSSGNYSVSFKAKASKPIQVVVVVPVDEKWDPTIMWQRINLTSEEKEFSFGFDPKGADESYAINWLFGSPYNQEYTNVDVEISEVSVNVKTEN